MSPPSTRWRATRAIVACGRLSPMDALDFFLVRYDQVHRVLGDPAIEQLGETQWRSRPHLEAIVPKERVERVASAEGAVAPGAEWLTEFWANGRSRAWVLAQTPLLHVYGHYFEARAVAGLWGARSL